MNSNYTESAFESVIESNLLANGYLSLDKKFYDKEKGLFSNTVLEFIQLTQPNDYKKLKEILGDNTDEQILKDLYGWLNTNGSLITMRHGFKCYGRNLRIAFFKATHSMNPELEEKYLQNKITITRQLKYSLKNENSIDIVIGLNGIPILTMELKNPITGQTYQNAIHQYQNDRDANELIFEFKKRTLVHFAVDTEVVFMATRLAGNSSYFLPFNKGLDGGAGNPANPNGYRTSYLWEEVLEKNSLMDLLARFMNLQVEEKRNEDGKKYRKETLIFPRYHQLEAVRNLVYAAQSEGVGYNYLVEHSAGSGKSNTIAWLTHRLASLHTDKNERVFDSVIVVTDRLVLDQQLQDTIYQFEHKHGVVQKIDENSKQLAEALTNRVPIIITTLQKFPFVSKQLIKMAEGKDSESGLLPTRQCAVIIDEAHSSQSGESAAGLKEVLGGDDLLEKAKQKAKEEGMEKFEILYHSMMKRNRIENLSFFAFTATPKHKTLKMFGRMGEPFHSYTMRQAIEEGFILDVLKNYTTYKVFYKLLKAAEEDPNVKRKKAAQALSRFMRLHEHNISQKTEIMVEHFNHFTRHKIGGRAKAMLVTNSRLEAVRYKESFDAYIKDKNYPIKTVVAFSGKVIDEKVPDKVYTEVQMNNGIKETELPERFATPEFQVLLVAEKFQTGFDQPLLHTMYIDKRLAGIQAVQTLSRLNRIHPLKEDTFILDFYDTNREEVKEAFKQYYDGSIMGEEVELSKLYEIKAELDSSGIYLQEEVNRFSEIYFKPKLRQNASDHKAINSTLDPAIDRYKNILSTEDERAEYLRKKLTSFRNLYSFLSQVIPFQDSDLEKLYTFLRLLYPKLPKRQNNIEYNFDDEIRLEYYRIQKISEGSIQLKDGAGKPLDGPTEVGSGGEKDESIELSRLVDLINDRFGTDFTEADQLFFDQIVSSATNNQSLQQAAKVNSLDKFELIFNKVLENIFIERMDQNEDIFAKFMNDEKFQKLVQKNLIKKVYETLNKKV